VFGLLAHTSTGFPRLNPSTSRTRMSRVVRRGKQAFPLWDVCERRNSSLASDFHSHPACFSDATVWYPDKDSLSSLSTVVLDPAREAFETRISHDPSGPWQIVLILFPLIALSGFACLIPLPRHVWANFLESTPGEVRSQKLLIRVFDERTNFFRVLPLNKLTRTPSAIKVRQSSSKHSVQFSAKWALDIDYWCEEIARKFLQVSSKLSSFPPWSLQTAQVFNPEPASLRQSSIILITRWDNKILLSCRSSNH